MNTYASYPPELAADFIEQWEGFHGRTYLCPAGKLTIGFGHTENVKADLYRSIQNARRGCEALRRRHVTVG